MKRPKKASAILRRKIYIIIFRSDTYAGKLFDVILLIMILLSILSVFLESVASIRVKYGPIIYTLEWVFTILFTIEYALRIYSSSRPKKYIFSFYGAIDLIAFLPTYLSLLIVGSHYLVVVRAFRLLRVFRVLKLTRYMYEGNILSSALKGSLHKIVVFLASVVILVTIIGTLMYLIEGNRSGFTSIPTSIYWAIVTITTVGYGDISPESPLGQFLASILMIIGYGIIAVPTGIVSVEMARATEEAKRKCTHCHLPIHSTKDKFCAHCGKEVLK